MQYKTIVLELLKERTELHEQLRKERSELDEIIARLEWVRKSSPKN